ncbi:VanZ family protein [Priestia aryabhattai]|uniref:VanZ family protein n=1 Tax=Priestia aryabhattai TaxID=412384 RepID=UPI001CCEE72E|nr:VanZ family protein [Priestia aryabhattai]MBZ6489021.1 VanZ family protein [Priestia aryabhattai]
MSKKKLINILFSGSILFIIYLTIFPESSLCIGVKPGNVNLVPFHTIGNLLFYHSFGDFIINNIGNIILFIPFGFLLSFKYKDINSLSKGILVGMAFSMLIETVQLFMENRWTDIDDVILNTLGTSIGYSLFKFLSKIYKIT